MKYSQQQLLTEGFWDGFKPRNWGKVAKGAIRMGADIARSVAPEITRPLDKLETSVRGYGKSFEQGYAGKKSKLEREMDSKSGGMSQDVSKKLYNDISLNMNRQNITILPQYGIKSHGTSRKNGTPLYILKGKTASNPKGEWLVVDSRGNIVN